MSDSLKHPLETMNLKSFKEINKVFETLDKKVTKAMEKNQDVVKLNINGVMYEANIYDPCFSLGWLYGMANWYKSGTQVKPD
tara:strand:+ start:438 stop:683 length:246 start_codon:yes stop_codon:yes gene_type:complete